MFPSDYTYHIVSDESWMEYVVRLLADEPTLAIDTETTGLDPKADDLVLIQIATPDTAYLFPAHIDLTALMPLLNDPKRTWLLQYAPFDVSFLYAKLGVRLANVYDTRRAEQQLGGKKRGLKDLALKYVGAELEKGEIRTSFTVGAPLTAEQAEYSAIDALVLWPIFIGQSLANYGNGWRDPAMGEIVAYVDGTGPKPVRR